MSGALFWRFAGQPDQVRGCLAARSMPWSRPSCPSRRSRSGPAAPSPCTTTSRRRPGRHLPPARPRLLLRRERGCSSCMARAAACCSTSHWYATHRSSNSGPAGRAPGRPATHTCEPRLGQIAHFAAAGHEVIAFDYVGCGRSPKPQSWYAGLASASPALTPNPAKAVPCSLPSHQVRLRL